MATGRPRQNWKIYPRSSAATINSQHVFAFALRIIPHHNCIRARAGNAQELPFRHGRPQFRRPAIIIVRRPPPEKFLPQVIESGHSRFPVIGESKDDVIGILLAKDLLRYFAGQEFNVREMLRPAVFIPESKRLNVLLKDFRRNRNHMAIVVDEYGGVAGLVTIEDVLEQIVGEIEDEYDFDETEANILLDRNGMYRVKAQTSIEDFNSTFGTEFSDEEVDTIGGLLLSKFGRLPKRGEETTIDRLRFRVLRADSRRLHSLLVEKLPSPE